MGPPVRELAADDTSGAAFQTVSSKMDELRAGIATARMDALKQMAAQKTEFDSKLEELRERNRDAETTNGRLAEEIGELRGQNLQLRSNASELSIECHNITRELEVLQANISMAREFIARSVNSTQTAWNKP